jgi:molecular chaperone GrpE
MRTRETRGEKMADENGKPAQDQTAATPADAAAREGVGEQSPDIATLEGRIAELTDRLLRAHADMENLRKRTERDKEETAKYAITKFAREVLSIGDNLQRAIAAVPPGAADADPALKVLVDGVSLTEREFLNILERNGVKRILPEGQPFNPHQHQAMIEVENREVAPGTVVQVYQPGYVLEDRVLRPAMVVVAKGGAKPDKPDSASGDGSAPGSASNAD